MPEIRNVDAGDDRQLLIDAARRVIADQHTSPRRVQRTLRVGFVKARRLRDLMQDAGIIGPPVYDNRRPVLVKREDSAAAIAVLSQELTADA